MIANNKYTALEIITEAGFEAPESAFGNARIIIGGISGIVNPDHEIRVSEGTTELECIVGIESKTILIDPAPAE